MGSKTSLAAMEFVMNVTKKKFQIKYEFNVIIFALPYRFQLISSTCKTIARNYAYLFVEILYLSCLEINLLTSSAFYSP